MTDHELLTTSSHRDPPDLDRPTGMTRLAALPGRAVIEIGGEDRVAFLQGLVSNDVAEAAPGRAVWAALLTPQGKYLADFFILADGDRLLLDVERTQVPLLVQRLTRFRLRSKVTIRAADELLVHAAWGGVPKVVAIAAADPRLPDAGWRVLAPAPLPTNAGEDDFGRHRLGLGLPDGTGDLEVEKTVLLEAGFDELHGVSWNKGCYMGQELTARTKYRGLVKRRLVPVAVDGPLPEPGTLVQRDGIEVGTMRSGRDGIGLAVLRLDALNGPLACGEARLTARVPGWMRLPERVG
jgi:tRNA-modifying protein YgfZ